MKPTTKALLVYAAAIGGLLLAIHAKAARRAAAVTYTF